MAKKLIIDTNLSILFFVGITNISYISKHKRLRGNYDEFDFEELKNIMNSYGEIIFTPNVLSETSNLIRYMHDPIKSEVSAKFGEILSNVNEQYVQSKIAVQRVEFLRLGLTDSVILELNKTGATLLTSDLDLYLAACYGGHNAINYNHIREERYDN